MISKFIKTRTNFTLLSGIFIVFSTVLYVTRVNSPQPDSQPYQCVEIQYQHSPGRKNNTKNTVLDVKDVKQSCGTDGLQQSEMFDM